MMGSVGQRIGGRLHLFLALGEARHVEEGVLQIEE